MVNPAIAPGVAMVVDTVIDSVLAGLVVQLLDADTVTFPFAAEHPKSTLMLLVPCPDVMVQPTGTDHVYEVALAKGEIEYATLLVPFGTVVRPAMVPGFGMDPPIE